MQLPANFILIDKPSGLTSFDVIRELRKRTGIKKWGHTGTLDPRATGLMLLAHDGGTKRIKEFVALDKEYVADILLGTRTTTGDMDGKVVEECAVAEISPEFQREISTTLTGMLGTLRLPVSAYSAMKKGGVPMYKRAYAAEKTGEDVGTVPVRDMEVFEAEVLNESLYIINDIQKMVLTVRFRVGSGTYIRSLAEELGKRLGYPATLKNLRRTKVGEFRVEDAQQLSEVGEF